jgi:hypothetical protein
MKEITNNNIPPPENAISSEDDSSEIAEEKPSTMVSPNVDPEVVAYIKEHFND